MSGHTFDSLIRHYRKFKDIDKLEMVVERGISNANDEPEKHLIDSAADHRRAEIITRQLYNAGGVPASAWSALLAKS